MILTNLNRQERNAKLLAIATSPEVQMYSLYHDYYRGIHFVRSSYTTSDYDKSNNSRVTTRSGTELYDEHTSDDKVIVKSNWCAPIIETIGDYTRGVNEPIVINADQKEDELRQIWEDNKIDTMTHELAYEAGIFGKSFIRLKRDDAGQFTLKQLDPASVYECVDPITGNRDSVIFWFGMSKMTAKLMYPNLPLEGSSTGEVYYSEEWDNGLVYKYVDGYQINEINDDGQVRDLNPYGFIPFFEVPGNIYRSSDIHDVISLNDELNITLTYVNEIFRYSAFPMLAPKGSFTNDTPVLSKEQLQEVEISPKTILPIPMERIEGKGVDSSVGDHIDQIKKDISIVSGVPMKMLMAELDGTSSGIALERMLGAVIKQAEVRRSYIRQTYKEINKAILTLLGVDQKVKTDVIFPEMIKIDMNERLDEAIKKQTIGLSRETIMDELGYDYEDEEAKRKTELENSVDNTLNDELRTDNQDKSKKGTDPQEGRR